MRFAHAKTIFVPRQDPLQIPSCHGSLQPRKPDGPGAQCHRPRPQCRHRQSGCDSTAAIPSLTGELVPKFLLKWRKPWALHGKPHASRPVAHALHAQGQTAQRFRSATRIEFQGSKLIFFRKTQGRLAYLLISAILPTKAVMNALSNSIACMLTLCLQSRQRARALGYWRIVLWHALGRPQSWGLPDKCRS